MAASRRAAIIGGGITGTLSALALLQDGWQVTILEAGHVGSGSSSRTAAGIRQQFSTPGTVRAMRFAVAFYANFRSEEGTPSIVQAGYLFLHDDPARWRQAQAVVEVQRAAGLTEVEVLSPDDVAARFPWVDADVHVGGTFCPTDGFLRPEIVYQEAARRVRSLGGTIVQRAPVTGAEHAGERIVAVHTPRGAVAADVFVDASNAWSRRVAPLLGAEVLPVDPLKRYLWFLRRGPEFPASWMARMPLTIAPSGAYCRPENADTLLYGKKHDVSPQPDFEAEDQDTIEPEFSHKTGIDAVPYGVWMELAAAMPPLAEFEGVLATTAGFYGTTPDHNPFLGYDRRVANLVRAVGFSGHGAMMGPFSARVVAALCDAGHDLPVLSLPTGDVDLAPFRIGRGFDHGETMVI